MNPKTNKKKAISQKKDCDCIAKTAEALKKKALEDPNNPTGFKIIEADYEYRSWFPKTRLYVNFIVKNTFTKKDGTTSKPRNSHFNVFFTYCPFCGKKLEN